MHLADSGEVKPGFPSTWPGREQIAFEMKVIQVQNQKGFALYQEDPVTSTLPAQCSEFIWRTDFCVCVFFPVGGK